MGGGAGARGGVLSVTDEIKNNVLGGVLVVC